MILKFNYEAQDISSLDSRITPNEQTREIANFELQVEITKLI